MTTSFLALGGNEGDVQRTFDLAAERLHRAPRVSVAAVSSVHRTPAVGEKAGRGFLNAAVQLDTSLPPLDLLQLCISIEAELGRKREVRWGPRTLDLDILLYGGEIIEGPELRVPHPACWYRRFVLDPLEEIAADAVHPVKQATVATLRNRLLVRPLQVAVAGGDPDVRRPIVERLPRRFPNAAAQDWSISAPSASVADAATVGKDGNSVRKDAGGILPDEPAILFWLGPGDGSEPRISFQSLPLLPRLDASQERDAELFAIHVVQSALGSDAAPPMSNVQ